MALGESDGGMQRNWLSRTAVPSQDVPCLSPEGIYQSHQAKKNPWNTQVIRARKQQGQQPRCLLSSPLVASVKGFLIWESHGSKITMICLWGVSATLPSDGPQLYLHASCM